MLQLTVFGASGKVGHQVVGLALEKGHPVLAFVHSRDPFAPHPNLKVVKGDIRDRAAVAASMTESKWVISALGSWGTKEKDIVTTGMQAIIPAMEQLGIKRLVTLTGAGARWSGDRPNIINKASHAVLKIVVPKILHDGEEHLRLLDTSKLEWTTLRSPVMRVRGNGSYQLGFRPPSLSATIPRLVVAQAMVDQLESFDHLRSAPFIFPP